MSDISAQRQLPTNLHAILLMVVAMAGFALTDTLIRMATTRAGLGQIILLQGVFGLIFYGAMMVHAGQRLTRDLITDRIVLFRISGDLIAVLFLTAALAVMPLGEMSALMQTQPLVLTIAAVLFLREQVSWFRWAAVFVGFGGALIILRPGTDGFSAASLLVLGGVVGLTIRDLLTRVLPVRHETLSIATLSTIAILIVGTAVHVVSGEAFVTDPNFLFLMFLSGSLGAFSYLAIIKSMRIGEISAVAPFRYSRLVTAFLAGYVLLGETPDAATLIGSALIVGAGLVVLYRERKRKRA